MIQEQYNKMSDGMPDIMSDGKKNFALISYKNVIKRYIILICSKFSQIHRNWLTHFTKLAVQSIIPSNNKIAKNNYLYA